MEVMVDGYLKGDVVRCGVQYMHERNLRKGV